jgi:Zn finger protein HypA/HybF involved in hydrogenase expression
LGKGKRVHEYSLMQNVIQSVLSKLASIPPNPTSSPPEIILTIGALEIHSEEAFLEAFQWLTRGTILQGSHLQLTLDPGMICCDSCRYEGPPESGGADGHDPIPVASCPQCGRWLTIRGGRGILALEVNPFPSV